MPPPHTLTRQEFRHERPHGSYDAYLGYVNTKRKQRANRPIDPFAPLTKRGLDERTSVFGPTMNDAQLQTRAGTQARAQVMPLLKEIQAEIARRSGAEQQHLAGATRNYAELVGQFAPQSQQAYAGAEQSQAGVNAALSQALAGGGHELSTELAGKLGAINAPGAQVQQVAGGAAQMGVGAGNAQLATGSAELSRLIGHGAAAQEYGAKLPGIAGAEGLRRSSEIAGRYADENDRRTAEVNASLPGLIQGLLGDLTARDEGRRQNKAAAVDSELNRALQTAVFGKEYGLNTYQAQTDRRKAAAAARHNRQSDATREKAVDVSAAALGVRAGDSDERARHNRAGDDERARHNRAGEAKDAAKAKADAKKLHSSVDEAASRSRGILIGKDGKPILKYKVKDGKRVKGSGRTIPYKPNKSSSGGSTPPPGFPKGK